jgi:hypothetical protein
VELTAHISLGARFVDNPPLTRLWATVAIGAALSLIFALDRAA